MSPRNWLVRAILLAAYGCNGDIAGAIAVPKVHRTLASTCPAQRAVGSLITNPQTWDQCSQDADCVDGTNGRCLWFKRGDCSYDTCFSDSDCSNAGVCECRSSEADNAANFCVTGNCRVDSDCGPANFCSPSVVKSICGHDASTGFGYFCHTSRDSCVDDSDCGAFEICAYNLPGRRWTCITQSVCF